MRRALAAIGFLFLFVTVTPLDSWWTKWLAGPSNDTKGDVLVVLAGDSIKDVIGESSIGAVCTRGAPGARAGSEKCW
jgi:hypothetical protein